MRWFNVASAVGELRLQHRSWGSFDFGWQLRQAAQIGGVLRTSRLDYPVSVYRVCIACGALHQPHPVHPVPRKHKHEHLATKNSKRQTRHGKKRFIISNAHSVLPPRKPRLFSCTCLVKVPFPRENIATKSRFSRAPRPTPPSNISQISPQGTLRHASTCLLRTRNLVKIKHIHISYNVIVSLAPQSNPPHHPPHLLTLARHGKIAPPRDTTCLKIAPASRSVMTVPSSRSRERRQQRGSLLRRRVLPRVIKRALLVAEVHAVLILAGVLATLAASLPSVDGPHEPRLLARALPRPVLLEVVLAGLQPATRNPDGDANGQVERGIDEEAPAVC